MIGESPLIENVSDTARWVAYYRAVESERPDALFRDCFARELAGEKGKAIANGMPLGPSIGPAVAIRTLVIDEFLYRLIREGNVDMVINLASGLDARPYRMEIPSSLIWIEADLPEINAYKTSKMQFKIPRCELERIDADLSQTWARNEFFNYLRQKYSKRKAVVITEGLLMYLTELQVLALTESLNEFEPALFWIQDFFSSQMLKRLNAIWGKELSHGNTPFRFAPALGADYFKQYGWTPLDVRSGILEGFRLRRAMKWGVVTKFIYDLCPPKWQLSIRRLNGMALLRRTK